MQVGGAPSDATGAGLETACGSKVSGPHHLNTQVDLVPMPHCPRLPFCPLGVGWDVAL